MAQMFSVLLYPFCRWNPRQVFSDYRLELVYPATSTPWVPSRSPCISWAYTAIVLHFSVGVVFTISSRLFIKNLKYSFLACLQQELPVMYVNNKATEKTSQACRIFHCSATTTTNIPYQFIMLSGNLLFLFFFVTTHLQTEFARDFDSDVILRYKDH